MANPLIELNNIPATDLPVLSSPAYQLPPVAQTCDEIAADYARTYGLPQWVEWHLSMMYLKGRTAGLQEMADLNRQTLDRLHAERMVTR